MAKEYIEQRNGGYYILGTRVSLDSVVYAIVPQDVRVGMAIEELLMIWVASEAEEWVDVFDFVPI